MYTQSHLDRVRTVFHADLSDAHPGEEYWLSVSGKRHELVPHTPETRARARAAGLGAASMPDERMTHCTREPVDLPAHQVLRVHLKHTLKTFPHAKGCHGVSHVAIHIPRRTGAALAEGYVAQQPIDYVTTAKALVFHHADLINNDPDVTSDIYAYMDDDQLISSQFETLGLSLRQMGPPTETSGWARLVPYTPPANTETGYDGTTTYYYHIPTDDVNVLAGPVTTAMMKATKNDLKLQNKKWTQQTGTSVTPPAGPNPRASLTPAGRIELAAVDGDDWQPALQNSSSVSGLETSISVVDASKKQIKITIKNTYIRYLGAYIRFLDADGNPMSVPTWKSDDGTVADIINDVLDVQYDDLRFIGYVGPVNNVFAIPINGDPGVLEVTVTFPAGAVSAVVFGSGLGTGSDEWPKTPIVGGLLTGLLNLGVPAFMLGFQVAAQSYKPLYDIIEELTKLKPFVAAVIGAGVAFFGVEFGVSAAHKEMNWHAFATLSQLLFQQAATKALLWVEAETAGEKAAEEIPFAGWIIIAINIATGVAQIAETIVEVATSPWNIQNQISTSITTAVTIHPDPQHGAFPQAPSGSQASYTVKLIYKDETRPTVSQSYDVAAGSTALTLPATFPGNTLGGQVKLEADYFIDEWLAAKATTGWLENNDTTVAELDLFLIQFPVPLTAQSIYVHTSLLTYQSGAYAWQPTATAPTATAASANTSSTGNAISLWNGLSLSQKHGMLGFAWKAAGMGIVSATTGQGGQLNAMQNIDIPGMPMSSVKFPSAGFDDRSQLIYDPYPPKFLMKDGQWVIGPDGKPAPDPGEVQLGNYYIDSRKSNVALTEGGGYHLRQVTLDATTPFDLDAIQPSFGRFAYFPDSFALHPSGHVIAVSALSGTGQVNKIQIMKLEATGAADSDVPVARTYAGEALDPARPGLLFYPVAVTCSYDGTIFVLEDTKSSGGASVNVVARIQGFDLQGNPVNRFFDAAGSPSPFLNLSRTGDYTYLDISAVGDAKMTYLYVLYHTGDGSAPADYHMAIYQYGATAPATNPLVTTDDVAAARVTVDMWHTVYTLNYDMVTDGNGNHAGPKNATTGPAGRTVPSISEWLPPVPKTGVAGALAATSRRRRKA